MLKAPDIPSVLLELGFLSNPDDEKRLTSEAWRDRTAEAVAEIDRRLFRQAPRPQPLLTLPSPPMRPLNRRFPATPAFCCHNLR